MKIKVSTTKDLDKVFAELQKRINIAQTTDVATTVREEMKDQIEQEVYSVYTPDESKPNSYKRKKEDGGLTDDDNIDLYMTDTTTLVVESNRFDGDKNVGEVVVTGKGYNYSFPYSGRPRDYVEATRDSLETTGVHVKALKQGLQRQKLNVK